MVFRFISIVLILILLTNGLTIYTDKPIYLPKEPIELTIIVPENYNGSSVVYVTVYKSDTLIDSFNMSIVNGTSEYKVQLSYSELGFYKIMASLDNYTASTVFIVSNETTKTVTKTITVRKEPQSLWNVKINADLTLIVTVVVGFLVVLAYHLSKRKFGRRRFKGRKARRKVFMGR